MRVVLIEDDRQFRDPLAATLESHSEFTLAGTFGSGEDFLAAATALQPDIVILDLNLPGIPGEECIRKARKRLPELRFVVLTVLEDPDRIVAALEAGACAYLTKKASIEEIVGALRQAVTGGGMLSSEIVQRLITHFNKRGDRLAHPSRVTPRERQVLELMATGLSSKEIAQSLGVSTHTVNDYLKSIFSKLQVHSRTAAIDRYFRRSS